MSSLQLNHGRILPGVILIEGPTNGVIKLKFNGLNAYTRSKKRKIKNIKFQVKRSTFLFNQKINFSETNMVDDECFYIKTPLYPFKYQLQLKFGIFITIKGRKKTYQRKFVSKKLYLQIPPMTLCPRFEIGDCVTFNNDKNCGEIIDMNTLKGTVEIRDNDNDERVSIDAAELLAPIISREIIVDLDKDKDRKIESIHSNKEAPIYDALITLKDDYNQKIFKTTAAITFVARTIVGFIKEAISHHKIRYRCPFDERFKLKKNNTWYDYIGAYQDKCQYLRETDWCYVCDICRVEMTFYDMYYECDGNDDDDGHKCHVFCMSCINSMDIGYRHYKKMVYGSLGRILDNDCMEEIVTFCAGNISIFPTDNKKEVGDVDEIGILDQIDIEDDKPVGTKRHIVRKYEGPRKRRRWK